jgi:soluble lytic murein transglycosylase-like protein
MKKLLDKLFKMSIMLFTILIIVIVILEVNANLYKNNDNLHPLASTVKKIIVLPVPEEEKVTPKVHTKIKPLSEREIINSYVKEIATQYNIEPELIMSVIQQESKYNPNAKNGTCLGLMQISKRWHAARARKLGITNFYDPYSNILLGVDYLSELFSKYKDTRLVLMLYNMGHQTAFQMYSNGQISTYAKTVIKRAEQYKKGV